MQESQPNFTAEPNLNVEDYRPISAGSITALVIGMLSIGAVFNSYLLIVPIIGIVVGAYNMIRIQASKGRAGGLLAATIGLSLALFFGLWSMSYASTRSSRIYDVSTEHCERWFELLKAKRYYEAFEMKMRYSNRKIVGTDLEKVYSLDQQDATPQDLSNLAKPDQKTEGGIIAMMPGTPKYEFEHFFGADPMETVVANIDRGDFELLYNEVIERQSYLDVIKQVYAFNYQDESGADQQIRMRITLERWHFINKGYFHWNILHVEDADTLEASSANPNDV